MSSGDEGKGGNVPDFASKFVGDYATGFEGYMNEPRSEPSVSLAAQSSKSNVVAAPQSGSARVRTDVSQAPPTAQDVASVSLARQSSISSTPHVLLIAFGNCGVGFAL